MLLPNNRSNKDYQFVSQLEVISDRKYKFHQEKKRCRSARNRMKQKHPLQWQLPETKSHFPQDPWLHLGVQHKAHRAHRSARKPWSIWPWLPHGSREVQRIEEAHTTVTTGNTHWLQQWHIPTLVWWDAAKREQGLAACGLWSYLGRCSNAKLNLSPVFYLGTDSWVSWCFWPLQVSVVLKNYIGWGLGENGAGTEKHMLAVTQGPGMWSSAEENTDNNVVITTCGIRWPLNLGGITL